MRPKPWIVVVLAAVLGIGAWLRLASLDRLSFWADEYPHAIAARSLIDGRGPVLPSGISYRRALGHTVLVAASMRLAKPNEAAARLPSAIAGLATIPLVWLAIRRRWGDAAGVAAAVSLTLLPLHVAHSRSARFYAAFALAYGASAVLGSRAIRSGAPRAALGAAAAFAVALHLQVLAVTVLLPLAVEAALRARGSGGTRAERELRRRLRMLIAGAAAVLLVVVVIPAARDELVRVLERPVPGLELAPGLRLGFFGRVLGLVAWWAWIPLAPAALWALRRGGRDGLSLVLHLAVPAVAMSVVYRPTGGAGVPIRYAIQLAPFVAALAGIGAAEIGRRVSSIASERVREPLSAAVAIVVAAAAISGVGGAFRIPTDPHPGRVIPRPNFDAAAAAVASRWTAGDALLSTGPLAMAWTLGRCGDWLRSPEAAAPFMRGGRDVYCGSSLVGDASAFRAFVAMNPRGWIIADPTSWMRHVGAETRRAVENVADAVTVDSSVLVYRWGR